MIYAYCIHRESEPGPPTKLEGIDGAAVGLHRSASFGVWISEIVKAPLPTAEGLRAHERVVREALRTETPLPLRFGTTFPGEGALVRSLDEHAERFHGMLERFSGLVELGIRVEQRAPTAQRVVASEREAGGPPESGRAYLERRRAELDAAAAARVEAESVLTGIGDELKEWAVETTHSTVLGEGVIGHVACLVRRADVSLLRARVTESLVPGHPNHRLVLSGPWAPYSFADE